MENVKNRMETKREIRKPFVTFIPRCPGCGHIGKRTIKIQGGIYTVTVCSKCGYTMDYNK